MRLFFSVTSTLLQFASALTDRNGIRIHNIIILLCIVRQYECVIQLGDDIFCFQRLLESKTRFFPQFRNRIFLRVCDVRDNFCKFKPQSRFVIIFFFLTNCFDMNTVNSSLCTQSLFLTLSTSFSVESVFFFLMIHLRK